MAFTKITPEELRDKGVIGLPDAPELNTTEMQEKFDEIALDVIVPHFNQMADELDTEHEGVFEAIDAEETRAKEAEETLDGKIDDEIDRATGAEETLDGKIDDEILRAQGAESDEETRAKAAEEALGNQITALDGAVMKKATYDSDNDGVVDNSEKLNGHADSYFATAQSVSDLTTTVNGKMTRSVYDSDNDGVVDNSKMLDGHTSPYFATAQSVTTLSGTVALKMDKSVYDADGDGVVDNAKLANNHTVNKDVPANAVFTDTVYDDTEIRGKIGNLNDLETSLKTDLVSAINEVVDGGGGGGGGSHETLASLDDVVIQNLEGGQSIVYDEVSQKWRNQGTGFKLDDVSGATATLSGKDITLTWTDPSDVTIGGTVLAQWKGTRVVRKAGSAPQNENDGTIIVNSMVRNQYSSTGYTDTTAEYNTTYYYRFFPYTTDNRYTQGSSVYATPVRTKITVKPTITSYPVYDGTLQTVTVSGYDTQKMTATGLTGTNAGAYVASFTPKEGYCWDDDSITPYGITWYIVAETVSVPTVSDTGLVYTGSSLSPTISAYDSTKISVTGDSATNAGTHYAIFHLIDSTNYAWSDTTTGDKSVPWTIAPELLTVPTVTSSLTYNGSAQSPTISAYDSTKISVYGNVQTNAGNYNVVFHLIDSDNHKWSDESTTDKTGAWSIAKANGSATLSSNSVTLNGDHTSVTVNVTNATGALSVATTDPTIATASVSSNVITITSPDGESGSATINVYVGSSTNYNAASYQISVTASFIPVYGVEWDGSSTTAFSRTDDAANFTDPVPYYSGMTDTPSSPFDNILPWSGMTVETDSTVGYLVKIPKFWYKWTRNGDSMKLQIANQAKTGFLVSPAHADRGDGSGERDYVYIGQYHCDSNGYTYGRIPVKRKTISEQRTLIHNMGNSYWQQDFAMFWTIRMLYLVEFADWNAQAKIGMGGGDTSVSTTEANMVSSISYHTGTTAADKTTKGYVKYRNIAHLWSDIAEFIDGLHHVTSGSGYHSISCCNNPANFSDTDENYTSLYSVPRQNNTICIKKFGNPVTSGFEYALYPVDFVTNSNYDTYIADAGWNYYYTPTVICGCTGSGAYIGMFNIMTNANSGSTIDRVGSRMMKLP